MQTTRSLDVSSLWSVHDYGITGLTGIVFLFKRQSAFMLRIGQTGQDVGVTRRLSTEEHSTMWALSLAQKKACIMRCHVYATSRPPHQ